MEMSIHVDKCTHMYMYAYICICMHIHHMHIRAHTCTYMHMYIQAVHVHVHVHGHGHQHVPHMTHVVQSGKGQWPTGIGAIWVKGSASNRRKNRERASKSALQLNSDRRNVGSLRASQHLRPDLPRTRPSRASVLYCGLRRPHVVAGQQFRE